jgi:hypothetical protein
MPTAPKKKLVRKPTLRGLSRAVSRLQSRVQELEDLRDLNEAIERNQKRPGLPWSKVKAELHLN